MKWFDVDKAGLAQLLEKRGRAFAVCELVQNAWDQDVTEVSVTITREAARTYTISVVDDDPNGWLDISHAFTLFAPSNKKGDPTKRGRFNLGEKLVLALCSEAEITTVSAAVRFDEKGRRSLRRRRERGSEFRGTLTMTVDDMAGVESVLRSLIAPRGITTFVEICGHTGGPATTRFTIRQREAVRIVDATLPTVLEGEGGALRRTKRKTSVELIEPEAGEKPHLYEMGIPVVELDGDECWHVNVMQKVPLNLDRDNVTPAYLREVRVAVINSAHDLLPLGAATSTWVTEATEDDRCEADAVEKVMEERFGTKRVIYDPTDPEANKLAASEGYTVVAGGSLSGGQWSNVKASGAILPSGQVTPSSKPYDEHGEEEVKVIPTAKWTADQKTVVEFAELLHSTLLGIDVSVRIVHTFNHFDACYTTGHLDLNQRSLGHKWFKATNLEGWIDLLVHEFGHRFSGDHLSADYYRALTKLAARLAVELSQDGSKVRAAIRQITRPAAEKEVAL
jgi:hypothetical protein